MEGMYQTLGMYITWYNSNCCRKPNQ